jgi:GNAT superfamily N-acetyltransferase
VNQDPALTVVPLSAGMNLEFDALLQIYTAALPSSERKSAAALLSMLARPDYEFLVAKLDREVVGFAIIASLSQSNACLLEYMAVKAARRGSGIGAFIFTKAADSPRVNSRYLILEIEAEQTGTPDSELQIRRRDFYRRLGCRQVSGLRYLMPPVSAHQPPAMGLFVFRRQLPAQIDREALRDWLQCLYTDVYGRPRGDSRIGKMLSGLPAKIELV